MGITKSLFIWLVAILLLIQEAEYLEFITIFDVLFISAMHTLVDGLYMPLKAKTYGWYFFYRPEIVSDRGRCGFLTSSLVLLEIKTRYAFSGNRAYAYALIIWLTNIQNLWKAKLSFISLLCIGDEHSVDINLVSLVPWRLHFDGSILKAIAIIFVLFIYLLMVMFLKPHAA